MNEATDEDPVVTGFRIEPAATAPFKVHAKVSASESPSAALAVKFCACPITTFCPVATGFCDEQVGAEFFATVHDRVPALMPFDATTESELAPVARLPDVTLRKLAVPDATPFRFHVSAQLGSLTVTPKFVAVAGAAAILNDDPVGEAAEIMHALATVVVHEHEADSSPSDIVAASETDPAIGDVGVNEAEEILPVELETISAPAAFPLRLQANVSASLSASAPVAVSAREPPTTTEDPVAEGLCAEHVGAELRVTVQFRVLELTAFDAVATNKLPPVFSWADVRFKTCVPETLAPLSVQATAQLVPLGSAEKVVAPPELASRAVAPEGAEVEIVHGCRTAIDHEHVDES